MADHQASTRALHESLQKQLRKLDVQEERLIDLAADGSLPLARIRTRLNKLAMERKAIEERMSRTDEELAAGAGLLLTSLEISRDPGGLYRRAPDKVRRQLNDTYFERFYIDEHGDVSDTQARTPFNEF
jgi:hypothetical protein